MNGDYEFSWHSTGRHKGDYFKVTDKPKEVWAQPFRTNQVTGMPELSIQAFEGVEIFGVIAEPGTKGSTNNF